MRPEISVCIPAYNAAPFLGDAISSVLDAATPDTQIIVVDDRSQDETVDVARSFTDNRITVVENPENLGRARNINRSMQLAHGEHLTVLPADSMIPANSLSDRLRLFREHDVAFAYGAAQFVDEGGKPTRLHRPLPDERIMDRRSAFASLLPHDPVYTITALIGRYAYEWSGGLRVEIAPSHRDWDFFLRLAAHGGLAYTPEIVALERQHKANFTQIATADGRMPYFELLIIDAIDRWVAGEAPDLATIVAEARRTWAMTQLGRAIYGSAGLDAIPSTRSIGLALMADPRSYRTRRFVAAVLATMLPGSVIRRVLALRDR